MNIKNIPNGINSICDFVSKEITDMLLLHDSSPHHKYLQIFFEIVIYQFTTKVHTIAVFLPMLQNLPTYKCVLIEQLISSVPYNYSTTKQLSVLQLKINSKSLE